MGALIVEDNRTLLSAQACPDERTLSLTYDKTCGQLVTDNTDHNNNGVEKKNKTKVYHVN